MLTAVIVFLLILIALLAIPVSFTYQVSWQQAFEGSIKLQWLFGLVHIQLPQLRSRTATPKSNEITQKPNRKKKSYRKKSNTIAVIRHKSFRQRVIRFVRDIWDTIHKHNVRLCIRIGLGDPADTGQIWAIVGPLSVVLSNIQEASISIEPEFIEPLFELDSSGNIRLIPLQIVYLIIGLLLSPSIWQGLIQARKAK